MKKLDIFIAAIVFIVLVGCESDSKSEYKPCADSEVYDASLNACRKMVCEDLGYKACEGKNGCFERNNIHTCGNTCMDCTTIEHTAGKISCQNEKCVFECIDDYHKDDLGIACEEDTLTDCGTAHKQCGINQICENGDCVRDANCLDCNGDGVCETHLDEYGLKSCSACADDYAACGETKSSNGIAIPLCLKLTVGTTDENIKDVKKTSCDVLCNYDDWQPRYETAEMCPGKHLYCEDKNNDENSFPVQYSCQSDCNAYDSIHSLITTTYLLIDETYSKLEGTDYLIDISFTPPEPGDYSYSFKVNTCQSKQKCQLNINGYEDEHIVPVSGIYTYPFDIECVDE